MVFVWTGAEPSTDTATTAVPGQKDAVVVTGTLEVRSPCAAVSEALLVNPGSALCLGALIGAGDELCSPTVRSEAGVITVQRERFAYDLPRVSTFEPLSKRVVTTTISTVARTGFTRIDVESGRWTPQCHVAIGLTPIDTHRTVVRWRMEALGPARRLCSAGATAWSTSRRLRGRAADSAEALADTMPQSVDPGVLALRRARAS
jgi:hypothetical protein